MLKESGIDGAVVITTPQEVSLQDVRREINFCQKVGIRVLGVVENMAGFVCPSCNGESQIFKPSTGGARRMAAEMGVELLGSVPLDPRIGKSADFGVSFFPSKWLEWMTPRVALMPQPCPQSCVKHLFELGHLQIHDITCTIW